MLSIENTGEVLVNRAAKPDFTTPPAPLDVATQPPEPETELKE